MRGRYADFDKLEVLTRITGTLVNVSPLRVGAGREAPLGSTVDTAPLRVVFADGKSVPYIPGSSLKGVLRSLAESIARARNMPVHSPWDPEAREEGDDGTYCVICGTFGSTRLASHVRVYDAYPEGFFAPTFVKTGVGINRDFSGAQPGILYTEEQVAPYVRWKFMMDIVNIRVFPQPADERGGLLRELLELLANGMVQVGARRTVGYGLIRLVEGRYDVYEPRDGRLAKVAEGEIRGGDL
ncbi:RAMP superfamily CRISPR-associated protein [Infirmifilum sp. NZ]|uniref:RAMP superfamily CRISPR-associated protein n=1 Tax=Infirmifilum sp. NZ TaxID=2926850 RepID=UPI0027A35B4E|nr:RAMP superfamily CRISPR-associated protein [Infirmifilum sp. NZ]UNQ73760.1 RAMP superfamily CRISPR-associated protein [Infirmifilum sp. NZ]